MTFKSQQPLGRFWKEVQFTQIDYINTARFLSKLGYDINKNIHTQFMEKYNLIKDYDRDIV